MIFFSVIKWIFMETDTNLSRPSKDPHIWIFRTVHRKWRHLFWLCVRSIDWLNAKNLFTQPRRGRGGCSFSRRTKSSSARLGCRRRGRWHRSREGVHDLRSRVALGLHARTTIPSSVYDVTRTRRRNILFPFTLPNYLRSSGCLKNKLLWVSRYGMDAVNVHPFFPLLWASKFGPRLPWPPLRGATQEGSDPPGESLSLPSSK